MTASGWGRLGGEGIEYLHPLKKEKGLMDMDNSLVIAGGEGHKGSKWQWKKYNKDYIFSKEHFRKTIFNST